MKEIQEKNAIFIDISNNNKEFISKIFSYFYCLLQEKKEFKFYIKIILILI